MSENNFEKLQLKTDLLALLKTFIRYDWAEDILRLTREVKDLKKELAPEDLEAWEKIEKKMRAHERKIKILTSRR